MSQTNSTGDERGAQWVRGLAWLLPVLGVAEFLLEFIG